MSRRLDSFVGCVAVVLFIASSQYSFVTVVPWAEHAVYQQSVVLCSLSVLAILVWLVLKGCRRQFVRLGLGVLMLVVSGFFLWGNFVALAGGAGVRIEAPAASDIPSACDAARRVLGSLQREGPFTVTQVGVSRRGIFEFSAVDGRGNLIMAASKGGGEWSVRFRISPTGGLPKTDVETVFAAILSHDQSAGENDDIRIHWYSRESLWCVSCYSSSKKRIADYSINDDLTGYDKESY